MSGCARFILVNYKQDLLGKNTVDNIGTFVLKGNENFANFWYFFRKKTKKKFLVDILYGLLYIVDKLMT